MFSPGALVEAPLKDDVGLVLAARKSGTTWKSWYVLPPGEHLVLFARPATPIHRKTVPQGAASPILEERMAFLPEGVLLPLVHNGHVPPPIRTVVEKSLGVVCTSPFEWDGRKFLPGWHGTIERFFRPDGMTIRWSGDVEFTWSMPFLPEHMAFIDIQTGRGFAPAGPRPKLQAKKGQLLIVSLKNQPLSIQRKGYLVRSIEGAQMRVQDGDILECCVSPDVFLALTGSCQGIRIAPLGCPMKPFLHPFFKRSQRVEISSQDLKFRGQDLKGLQGVVLVDTDPDGDVGVQFEEELGAGSLDGLGPDGKCLFVPSGCLKVVSG